MKPLIVRWSPCLSSTFVAPLWDIFGESNCFRSNGVVYLNRMTVDISQSLPISISEKKRQINVVFVSLRAGWITVSLHVGLTSSTYRIESRKSFYDACKFDVITVALCQWEEVTEVGHTLHLNTMIHQWCKELINTFLRWINLKIQQNAVNLTHIPHCCWPSPLLNPFK